MAMNAVSRWARVSNANYCVSFPPIADKNARVLILGSMPGEMSLAANQYYAHPRNAFWPIMGALYGAGLDIPYPQRLKILKANGVALWESLQACVRPGSLDSNITDEVPNDFVAFFKKHLKVGHVFFNGAKAETSFQKHILKQQAFPHLSFTKLPSTSPAHAGMTLAAKLDAWRAIII